MSTSTKRDAQEAFGDPASELQQQKKPKARHRSRRHHQRHQGDTAATNDAQPPAELIFDATAAIVKPERKGDRVSPTSARPKFAKVDGEKSSKLKNGTLLQQDSQGRKDGTSAPVSDSAHNKGRTRGRRSRVRKHLKNVEEETAQSRVPIQQDIVPVMLPDEGSSTGSAVLSQEQNIRPADSGNSSDEAQLSRSEIKKLKRAEEKAGKITDLSRTRKPKNTETPQQHKAGQHSKRIAESNRNDKSSGSQWSLSASTGGAFINHDPVLTFDEQTIFLATDSAILIYSTKTSLLVRSIHISGHSAIVTYTLTSGNERFLLVGIQNGNIYKYEWTTGKRMWHFKMHGHLKSITSTSSGVDEDNLLIVHSSEGDEYDLISLNLNSKGQETGRNTLISKQPLTGNVKFASNLGIVVICSADTAFIGQLPERTDGAAPRFEWNKITFPNNATCFDAQILSPTTTSKSRKHGKLLATVNIAVGFASGEIQMYSDVLSQGAKLAGTSSSSTDTRRLHWHRTAPLTVKFSPDSNYLVSGGDETVLVIWQLDTNQKQVLPHLTTPILNLAISHQGSAYAIRLADNSIMVLSTADLQPFANVNGLALSASNDHQLQPAILHPLQADRLLLAHSLKALKLAQTHNRTMMQTYDVASNIQVGSQALARNLVSTVNITPSGQAVQEPNVTHLDISHDGTWLASIDRWSPKKKDLDELYLTRGDTMDRFQGNECYLRLWASTAAKNGTMDLNGQWELNTRVDESTVGSEWITGGSNVLAIIFSPVRQQLAVADTNRRLKIYSPKARMRSGLPIRDEDGKQLFTWTCDHEIPFTATHDSEKAKYATLAFSEDGSVLAACWVSATSREPRIYLIDPKLGIEATSIADLVKPERPTIGFYRQYLICLSGRFCIFDTVTAKPIFELELLSNFERTQSRMAIDVKNGVLAMYLDRTNGSNQLVLFDVRNGCPDVVFKKELSAKVRVLLADKVNGGFVVIYKDGKIARLSIPGKGYDAATVSTNGSVEQQALANTGIEHIFGSAQKQIKNAADSAPEKTSGSGHHGRTLEDIFRFDTTAQVPSVKDLFTQVAQVVVGGSQ